jgi:DNA-binding NarL/FixJ family response regulator
MPPSTVLLVDDHSPTRDEMRSLLSREAAFQVVAQADAGEEAIQQARLHHPDLVVMDIFLPGISGVEATLAIIHDRPGTRVVALSNHCGKNIVQAFLKAGGMGYVRKSCAFEELIPALQAALAGTTYLGQQVNE